MNDGSGNEIRLIRRYDAAVSDVWDAWVDPGQVGEWEFGLVFAGIGAMVWWARR